MNLTSQRIRQLLEISYTLEPLLNKNDCTTRFIDLPNKPIYDFIIAGLNVSHVYEDYADSVINQGNKLMFSHYSQAVSVCNQYKSKKTINLGLMEMMLVFIKARLAYSTPDKLFNNLVTLVKTTTNQDVLDNLDGFNLAISTSTNDQKKQSAKNNYAYFSQSPNIYVLFERILEKFPDPTFAGHQVANQYLQGFPIVKRYFTEVDENKGLIKSIEDSFNEMHQENPQTKIGLLADLSAIAIFTHLSFKTPNYIIR